MKSEHFESYVLKFHAGEFSLESEERNLDSGVEYIVQFSGDMIWRKEDQEEDLSPEPYRDQVVGRFQGYVIHAARALNDGIDLWDHCDAHSQDIYDYAATFYDADGGLNEALEDILKAGGIGLNLLIIDEIALHPDHRGQMVGLRTMRRLLELLGDGCGFAATIPYPLQFQDRHNDSSGFERHPEQDRKRAERQLAHHIKRLGFQRLPKTRIYALSMACQLPSIKDADRQAKVIPFVLAANPADPDMQLP